MVLADPGIGILYVTVILLQICEGLTLTCLDSSLTFLLYLLFKVINKNTNKFTL